MKKKEILFTITAIFILIITTAYYVAFVKPKNINFDQSNIEISEEDDNENIEEEPPIIEEPEEPTLDNEDDIYTESEFINKYKWLGYKEVEITDKLPEFKERERKINKIEINETKNDSEYADKICNIKFYSNLEETCVNIEVINNKSYFIFNNQKLEIPIDNIKKVYISRYYSQSPDEFIIYFLTIEGDVYEMFQGVGDSRIFKVSIDKNFNNIEQLNKEISERLNDSIKNIKKVNTKIKYKELFILEYDLCFNYKYVGLGYDGETYSLQDELKIIKNQYTFSQYYGCFYGEMEYRVTMDGDIIVNDVNTNVKFKFSIHGLIFSDKNTIYNIEYNFEKSMYELQEIGKLKLLYVNKNKKRIAILLDDGKTIEYSFSYDGLQNIDF